MRGDAQERAILLARRLALGAVSDHDLAAGLGGDRGELRRGREPGAAAAAEPRFRNEADRVARRVEHAVQREVPRE